MYARVCIWVSVCFYFDVLFSVWRRVHRYTYEEMKFRNIFSDCLFCLFVCLFTVFSYLSVYLLICSVNGWLFGWLVCCCLFFVC